MSALGSAVYHHQGTTTPKPFVYTFRLAQFRITDTRALHSDSDTIGYTLNVGSQSYTQTLPPVDVNNGNHDVGLEFPGIAIPDPNTTVTLAFAIANAGHDAAQVEALFQKGVDQIWAKEVDSLTKGNSDKGSKSGAQPRQPARPRRR